MQTQYQCRHLSLLDATLVEIYINACVNEWSNLPVLARKFYAAGGTIQQLRGCLRHLIVYVYIAMDRVNRSSMLFLKSSSFLFSLSCSLAGYGPCLAAFLALQKAKVRTLAAKIRFIQCHGKFLHK
jgi:hypothetical protein